MDIQVKNLNKSFNKQQVLNDVDMTFPEGRITCIMGPSGIGKTTLVYILMGLLKADSGQVIGLEGKKFAAVFQEDRLIEHWDAIKNVQLVSGGEVTKDLVKRSFIQIGLTEYEKKPVRALSGGMRRRVAMVRALLSEYDLLIMDEPFKGLDEKLKNQVIDYVKENTKGKTVIIITHDKEEVDLLEAQLINMEDYED
ncbi:MAG: ABC transporter ATP-binding protein [Clostridiales bacterium]|nr:ATP-binding cassette domain-containing protein [Bacillota bacterium]NLK02819.1 ABC transporter ATP-binding protein [Clostridiales bacterium]